MIFRSADFVAAENRVSRQGRRLDTSWMSRRNVSKFDFGDTDRPDGGAPCGNFFSKDASHSESCSKHLKKIIFRPEGVVEKDVFVFFSDIMDFMLIY